VHQPYSRRAKDRLHAHRCRVPGRSRRARTDNLRDHRSKPRRRRTTALAAALAAAALAAALAALATALAAAAALAAGPPPRALRVGQPRCEQRAEAGAARTVLALGCVPRVQRAAAAQVKVGASPT
jgi:hypothetical protein